MDQRWDDQSCHLRLITYIHYLRIILGEFSVCVLERLFACARAWEQACMQMQCKPFEVQNDSNVFNMF